jgi:hypothetical protein
MRGTHAGALGALLLISLTTSAQAEDFSSSRTARKWKVTEYHGNGLRPGQSPAETLPEGGIGMAFTTEPNTALLTTTDRSYLGTLLGDLTGGTVYAELGIVDADMPTYIFYPDGCSTPANVRLYFRTKQKALGESQYWWSNPTSISLASLTTLGSTTFEVPLEPGLWSDRAGHFGSDPAYTAAFEDAVADVVEIGVSFGGGCHFAFGVGVSSGSATFQLSELSVDG